HVLDPQPAQLLRRVPRSAPRHPSGRYDQLRFPSEDGQARSGSPASWSPSREDDDRKDGTRSRYSTPRLPARKAGAGVFGVVIVEGGDLGDLRASERDGLDPERVTVRWPTKRTRSPKS